MSEDEMRIGELATETGVSVRALRHYEAQGLIHSARRPNRYRDYPPMTIERVRHIRTLLECGFSTRQIRGFLPCLESESFGREVCTAGLERHVAKLAEIDALIEALKRRRERLVQRLNLFGVSSFNSGSGQEQHNGRESRSGERGQVRN